MEVTQGVEDAVDELRPGLPGMEIDTTIFRPATFIEQSIDNLTTALLIGVLLVVLIIVAFLFEWRTAFISLIAIPLSLIAAILVLDLRGSDDQRDGARGAGGRHRGGGRRRDHRRGEHRAAPAAGARAAGSDVSTFRVVLDASVEVRSAITYATVINVVAIVPVFFLQGLSGSFFQPLVLSYGLAVLVSMVVALTVTPALCLLLLSKGRLGTRDSPLLRVLKRGYGAILERVIRRPEPGDRDRGASSCSPGSLIYPTLGSQLLPNFKERDFLMHWLTEPATGADGGEAHLGAGLQGPARDPGRAQLRLAHRAGAPGGRGLRRLLRRELDQRRARTSTTTRRSPPSTGRSRATPASIATCRPICESGSRRC